jgi:hypothetical protein
MEDIDFKPISLNATISEIATILAKGYLRYRKGRSLGNDIPEMTGLTDKIEESKAFTEN